MHDVATHAPNSVEDFAQTIEGNHRLSVLLQPNQRDDLTLLNCEVASPRTTSRTTFKEKPLFLDVFCAEIGEELVRLLDTLPEFPDGKKQAVSTYPDWTISTRGCVLSGLRVIRSRSQDGPIRIMIRFRVFLGNLSQISTIDTSLDQDIGRVTDDIAFDVFCDVALPILNLISLEQPAAKYLTEDVARKLKHIFERSDELRFRTELLQRITEHSTGSPHPVSRKGRLEPFRQPALRENPKRKTVSGNRLVCEFGDLDDPIIW